MRAIITIGYMSSSSFTEKELKSLIIEQWEQTVAYGEGDTIEVIGIEIVDALS
jgi:hypothetical protein